MRKKFFLCGIMAAVLMVSGCSKGVESDDKEQTTGSVASNDYSVKEDIPTPYEVVTDMQDCTVATQAQEYNMETDYQYYYNIADTSRFDIMETENTIFFYEYFLDTACVKMMDKETKGIQVFCNKPECSHDTDTCNANFDNALGMFYYNGCLFIMRQEYFPYDETQDELQLNLYKVSIETQEREKIRNIATILTENSLESYSLSYIQHRGYLYYIYDVGTGGNSEIFYNNGSNSLYRIDLNSTKEKECIANMDRTDGLIVPFLHLQAAGSYVYYILPDETGMGEAYRFNTETLKNEALNLGKIATENFVIWNGDIYYKKDWEDTQIYRWNARTGEDVLYIDTVVSGYETSTNFYVGPDYMYVTCKENQWDEQHESAVFNKDGEMVEKIKFPIEKTTCAGGRDIFVVYESQISVQQIGDDPENCRGIFYVFNPDNIGKENIVFEKINLSTKG